jgi:tetratricopeptide (TPR) repeat protein
LRRLLVLLFLTSGLAFADEVFLKGAGSISGRIVEQTDTMVKVDIGGGIMGAPMSHVERIVKGRTPLDDYDERAAALGPRDAKGWRSLGKWASEQGLSEQSRQAYEKVLAIAPDDAEARQALGFVRIEGRWATEEESYRARGYVKYDGEWMTPAEVQVAQQTAAADQAAREADRRANDAAIAAMQAEQRASEAEERAREEREEYDSWNNPVYWGGWGYGVNYWPSTGVSRDLSRPVNRPVQRPAGGGRR